MDLRVGATIFITSALNLPSVYSLLGLNFPRDRKKSQGDIKSHIIDEFHHVDAALRG